MKQAYSTLCTEFYDLTKPTAGPKEIYFYESLIRKAKGPVLEAMCGSGRLLIPLLRKGLNVEGLDNSHCMLESCKKRCDAEKLVVQLYNQSLQNLSLQKKYDIIFIAIGSFQLIPNRNDALSILENLYSAILPEGKLVLETFIPWDSFKENIHGLSLNEKSEEHYFEASVDISDNGKIIHKSQITVNFKEQLEKTKSTYEKWVDKKLIQTEEEEYIVRWYHRYEMALFLQKAGFSSVNIIDTSFEQNVQGTVYEANKSC